MRSFINVTCCPSTPFIPTPTWAAVIILTSLAPSPTAKVETFGFSMKLNSKWNFFKNYLRSHQRYYFLFLFGGNSASDHSGTIFANLNNLKFDISNLNQK